MHELSTDDVLARLAAHQVWLDTGRSGAQFELSADPTDPAVARAAATALLNALQVQVQDRPPTLRYALLRGLRDRPLRHVMRPLPGKGQSRAQIPGPRPDDAGQGASAEATLLRDKLGDLSGVLDDYKGAIGP